MNTFKRILSAVLSAAMTISAASMISVGAANIQFTDVNDHWAWTNGQIPYLVDKGVLNGYEQANGTYMFKPDGNVKRSEFIKMMDETFGLTKTTSINFADVPSDQWYYTYFQKAAAQGFLLDYGTHANPTGEITREEAAALLVRYLDLPANEKADASTFADYSSINASYREYVLRAVYAGIINGYSENNQTLFKPTKTLTRAEALTILYRAAGCIFNENADYRSGKAHSTNNTITDSGITINNTVFSGRNIITEGAAGDTVKLIGCNVKGTLYVRGSANLILDDCDVDNLVLLGGGNVTIVSGTKIDSVDVSTGTSFTTYAGTRIGTLTVQYGADFTKVKGDGTIDMAFIRAREFSSSVIPTEFEIGNNLTAYFDETGFQGSSEAQNPFEVIPFTTADESYHYLNFIPNADGTVYYYFTNIATVPTTGSFDSHYSSASEYGAFEVDMGKAVTQETISADKASGYKYVAVQLQYGTRKYAPVLIENNGNIGTGFKTEPYVYDETTIKFQTSTSGTIYWFYADSGLILNQLDFLTAYENKESALKGQTDVTSIKSFSCSLKEKYLDNYDFVAFMLVTGTDTYHTPVVIPMGDNGFLTAPIVKTPGVITFKSSVAGDIFYYYSKTNDLPAASEFKSMYNDAAEKDNEEIYSNVESTVEFDLSEVDDYPYMIMAIRSTDGDFMLPVAVDINFTTGFRDEPKVSSATQITFRTKYDGSVQYYYTTKSIAPSIEDFHTNYDEQNLRYKGSKKVTFYIETINYDPGYASSYPFMAIMFTDADGKEYSPVLLELDAALETGLYSAPYAKDGEVFVHAKEDGEIWYYYTKDGESISGDSFEEAYDKISDSDRKDTFYISADTVESFTIDQDIIKKYPFIVIAFTDEPDERHPDFCFPFVLNVKSSEASNAGSGLEVTKLNAEEGFARVTLEYDGDIYYYCVDSKTDLPSNRSNFQSKYEAAEVKDRHRNLDAGDSKALYFNDYNYIVCALKVGDEFLDYIVIHHKNGLEAGSSSDILNSYDKSSYGFEFEGWNRDELTVVSNKSGTISMFAIQNGMIDVIESQDVNIGDEVVFDIRLTQNNIISSIILEIDVDFYLQLTDDDGNTYRPLKLSELN